MPTIAIHITYSVRFRFRFAIADGGIERALLHSGEEGAIEVPPGVERHDGVVAANFGKIGGGDQTVFPKVDPKWVVGDEAFA